MPGIARLDLDLFVVIEKKRNWTCFWKENTNDVCKTIVGHMIYADISDTKWYFFLMEKQTTYN